MRRAWALVAFLGVLLPALAVAGEVRLFVPRGAEADSSGPAASGWCARGRSASRPRPSPAPTA